MRLISINLNKRLGNARSRGLTRSWFLARKASLILAQEPYKSEPLADDALEEFKPVGGNEKVFAWVDGRKEVPKFEIVAPFTMRIQLGHVAIFNCYLDAYEQEARARQLKLLDSLVAKEEDRPVIMVGDFNLAPTEDDGLCDGKISNFNSNVDRGPLTALLARNKLIDRVAASGDARFTIDRTLGGRRSQFRCDLALVSDYFSPDVTIAYDHSVRHGERSFTDHSALVLDVPVTIANSEYHTGLLFPEWADGERDSTSKGVAISPHKTAIPRSSASPIAQAVVEKLVTTLGIKSVLDFGCGRGADLKYYEGCGLRAIGYDPHPPFGWSTFPSGQFDLVTVVFVLNVLPSPHERLEVLKKASSCVNPGAPMLVVTRSREEIEAEAKSKQWPQHNDGYWSHEGKGTFQKGINREELARLALRADLTEHPMQSRLAFGRDAAHVLLHRIP